MDGMRVYTLLAVVFASLVYSLGHMHTTHYQYAVRFLYKEECTNCTDQGSNCFLRVSQCATLDFSYFNVTVLNYTQNCTASVMLLLLKLQPAKEDDYKVYLDACINGMDEYQFWNYMACSTVTEGGGREANFVQCTPKEVPPADVASSTVLPNWEAILWTTIAVLVVIVLLAACVITYQFHRHRARGPNVDEGLLGGSASESGPHPSLNSSSQPRSQPTSLLQWLRDRGLVPPNWHSPTPRPPPTSAPGHGGGYEPIGDPESSRTPSQPFSWSQWLRDKGLVPRNWFAPTART